MCPHITSIYELIGCATPAGSGADDKLILKYYMLAFVLFKCSPWKTPYKEATTLDIAHQVVPPDMDADLRIVSS